MKILHIPQSTKKLSNKVNGITTVLSEEIYWENKIPNIESNIFIEGNLKKIEKIFLGKQSKNKILDYKPDIVIFNGFYILRHYFIAKFLQKNNIKYFIKPHGSFNKSSQKKSFLKKFLIRFFLLDSFVNKSEGIIFLSKEERETSIYRVKKEIILPNGITKQKNTLKKTFQDNNSINFIFLGRIDIFHKGIDILLDIIYKHKEYFINNKVFFNFYGKGSINDIKYFQKKIFLINEIVEFFGPIYDEKKYKILKESDIFILTSRYEGTPMGILEALSLGIPCFITKETCMRSWIEKYNCGFVNLNTDNLFEDLKKFIENYKENRNLYINNSLKCADEFYWDNIIKIYEKEYRDLKSI